MDVGITATKHGLSQSQDRALVKLLQGFTGPRKFRHGCCVGGDVEGAWIAYYLGYEIEEHPPIDQKLVALKRPPAVKVFPQKPYLDRNHDIVDNSRILVACPYTNTEKKRGSGTWATYRYAMKLEHPVFLIYPDGTVKWEGPDVGDSRVRFEGGG